MSPSTGHSSKQSSKGAPVKLERDFKKLALGGRIKATIRRGKSNKVQVHNLKPKSLLEQKSRLRRLELHCDAPACEDAELQITVAELDHLEVGGAVSVAMPDYNADALKLSLAGSSVLDISGHLKELNLSIAGASKLEGEDLSVAELRAQLAGASVADLDVTQRLNVDASGASVLRYGGQPKELKRKTSGAAKVSLR